MDRYNKCQTKPYTRTHTAHTLVGGQYLAGWPPRKTIRSSDSTRKALKYGALTNIYYIIYHITTRFYFQTALLTTHQLFDKFSRHNTTTHGNRQSNPIYIYIYIYINIYGRCSITIDNQQVIHYMCCANDAAENRTDYYHTHGTCISNITF